MSLPVDVTGEIDPLTKIVPWNFRVPLVVTTSQKAPWACPDDEECSNTSDQDVDSRAISDRQHRIKSFPNSDKRGGNPRRSKGLGADAGDSNPFKPHSMLDLLKGSSLFLKSAEEDKDDDESEDEDEDKDKDEVLPADFNYYFRAYAPSSTPPSVCEIGLFCMAEHHQIPLLMTSLLYQRRMWHIDEPLFGVGFSRYDTIVKLYVGWLDDEISPDCVMVSP